MGKFLSWASWPTKRKRKGGGGRVRGPNPVVGRQCLNFRSALRPGTSYTVAYLRFLHLFRTRAQPRLELATNPSRRCSGRQTGHSMRATEQSLGCKLGYWLCGYGSYVLVEVGATCALLLSRSSRLAMMTWPVREGKS